MYDISMYGVISIKFGVLSYSHHLSYSSDDAIEYLGNRIQPSRSGVPVSGVTFLLSNINEKQGIAFTYSAYIREQSPLRFQIWRPSQVNSTRDFILVSEVHLMPSVKDQREDVSNDMSPFPTCAYY